MNERPITFLKRYQIPIFFVLAFGLSWASWGTIIAQQNGWLNFHLPEQLFVYFSLTVATLLVGGLAGGKAALLDLWSRVTRGRFNPAWFGLALVIPVGLALFPVEIYRLLGGKVAVGVDISGSAALAYFAVFAPKCIITEELAWRGFALPRMQKGQSSLGASAWLGLIWGLWHIPAFLIEGSAQSRMPFLAFLVFAIAESILIGWIYNKTGGSVLIAALFHGASDAALSYSGVLFGDGLLFWLTVLVHWAAVGIILLVETRTHLTEHSLQAVRLAEPLSDFLTSLPATRRK
jgi:membrane protease YdiL (CAAX protease family)